MKLKKDYGTLKVIKKGITFEPSKIKKKDYKYYYDNGFEQYFDLEDKVNCTECGVQFIKKHWKNKKCDKCKIKD